MPADASIYNLLRAAPEVALENPQDIKMRQMQMRNMLLQEEGARLGLEQTRKGIADEQTIADLFRKGTPTERDIMAINPKRGLEYGKALTEREKAKAELDKTKIETLNKSLQIHRDLLPSVNDPQAAAQWIRAGFNDPVLSPIMQRAGSPEEVIAKIPTDPQGFAQWKAQSGLGIEKFLEHTKQVFQHVNTGGTTQMVQMNSNAPGFSSAPIQNTQSPDSVASTVTARRGQDMVDRRAGDAAERDKFGPLTEVTGPDGKPRLVIQNRNTGLPVDPNTRQPVGGVGPKVGETAQKQQTGVQNTRAAIEEYRAALKEWGATDIANPNARARMGTVYNNMLLQAKEAFNLGVLNGPDYMILQEVITNPASLKGGITGNQALDDQAKKLEEIMGRIGQQITTTQAGTPPPAPRPTPKGKGGIKFLGFEN